MKPYTELVKEQIEKYYKEYSGIITHPSANGLKSFILSAMQSAYEAGHKEGVMDYIWHGEIERRLGKKEGRSATLDEVDKVYNHENPHHLSLSDIIKELKNI